MTVIEDRIADFIIETIKTELNETGVTPAERLENAFRIISAYRIAGLKRAIGRRLGTIVRAGPFKGMKYLNEVSEGAYIPKILGSYECELHDVIERIAYAGYQKVVNIGCAEGYYAVGLATRCEAEIHAFDIDDVARRSCIALARLNAVSGRVTVGPAFDASDFARFEGRRTLVLCDIEGDEVGLLDPDAAPALGRMDMLVEVHNVDGIWSSDSLIPRFQKTHDITLIEPAPRDAVHYADLDGLSDTDRFFALLERIEPTHWAFFEAKGSG